LIISKSREIGFGNSARVYEAQISLEINHPPPRVDEPKFPSVLTVIAKVGTGEIGTEFLENEAKMYHSFPEHFLHEYTGYQLIKPCHIPRRLSQLVPHFYGYYKPVDEKIQGGKELRAPIILMEDCGSQIDPKLLTQYQKAEIYAMFQRFHNSRMMHYSINLRNILAQPGPIFPSQYFASSPRYARSMSTPSFRIIDFGRTRQVDPTEDGVGFAERSRLCEVLEMNPPV
ncbi:hypothetical protein BU17DRAFT_41999, partial [Hysterangium stoloniferum]